MLQPRQRSRLGLARWLLSTCLAASLAAAAQAAAPSGSARRLLLRPFPGGPNTCRNTLQGPWFLADDRGKVCKLGELNFATGCCSSGDQYACSMCNKDDSCCESFEHCVSCCMLPDNKPEERRLETLKIPSDKASGVWGDGFQYCMAACRTHKGSTAHENSYIGARHHCFSKLGKPLLSPPLPAGALDGVSVVLSAAGASCTTMCEQKGHACSQPHLHLLNSCDRLREVLACEAGCEVEAADDTYPASVDPEAPKASRPALCLVSAGPPAAAAFSCEATANHMQRLCACVAPGGSSQAAGGGGSQGEPQPPRQPQQPDSGTQLQQQQEPQEAGER